jgi:hypothetical protein
VFCLISVHFGLRARQSKNIADVWLSVLAAALMTGVKLSNLPLMLPCLIAVWPALKHVRRNLAGSVVVLGAAVLVSAAPMMALNQVHTGSWTGDPQDKYEMQIKNPVAGVLGNGFLLAEGTFQPPLLPAAGKINQSLTQLLPDWLNKQFPHMHLSRPGELPGEEGAGLGLGVGLPLLIAVILTLFRGVAIKNYILSLPLVAVGAWVAALFLMAKMGSEAGPRLTMSYYPLILVPFLLLPVQGELLRRCAWRVFLAIMALSVLPVIVLSVSRPLWPAQTISGWLMRAYPDSKAFQRIANTYSVYAHRNDILAPVRAGLPDSAREIGFIAGSNDTDYSLWRPFGSRKVTYLRHDISRFLQSPDVGWVVVKEDNWPEISSMPLADWAQQHQAKVVLSVPIVELVSWGPENWCLLHVEKKGPSDAAGR